jgi:hypothetical protein
MFHGSHFNDAFDPPDGDGIAETFNVSDDRGGGHGENYRTAGGITKTLCADAFANDDGLGGFVQSLGELPPVRNKDSNSP